MRIFPSILERYVGRFVLQWIIYVSLFLCLLSWLIKFMEQLRNVGVGTFTVMTAVKTVSLLIPHNFYVFFPLAALMGTVVALCLLSSRSELVVMQASGVSKLRILGGVLKMVLPLMCLVILVGEYIVPATEFKYDEIRAKTMKGIDLSVGVAGGVWARENNDFFYLGAASSEGEIRGVEKFTFNPVAHKMISHSVAQRAKFVGGKWHFYDINHKFYSRDSLVFSHADEEVWGLTLTPDKFNIFSFSPDELSIQGLYSYVDYLKKNNIKAERYELELWRKVLSPFAVITMIFLASSVVFGSMRSLSLSARIVLGIVYGFVFYVANQTFSPLSLVFGLPIGICVALPSVICFIVAVYLLRKR
ncbi:MAG: LPS export ABC transporter permease LptG [Succinivibrionaceae bacterium]